MRHENLDIQVEKPVGNDAGELCLNYRAKQAAWKEYYEPLSNVEFDWDSVMEVYPMEGRPHPPPHPISHLSWWSRPSSWWNAARLLIHPWLYLKCWKPLELNRVWPIRDLIEYIIHFGKILNEWEESIIIFPYNGKGVTLEQGKYRGLKLLDQVMKVLQRVASNILRQQVCIDDIPFGFMPERSTTDAIFIVRQLQEKFYAINKTLCMAFVDLEKAFDCVPRRVILWALCKLGIDEWLVRLIQSMYENARSRVRVVCNLVKSSVWKWAFTKALAWTPYYSSQFQKPFPKSFVQDVPGKTCIIWPGHHHWIAGGIIIEADPLEGQHGRKGTSGQHGQNQGPDIWTGSWCASEVWQRPLWHVSQWRWHKSRFLCWLFQLDPQEMQWHPWPSEVWCQLQV